MGGGGGSSEVKETSHQIAASEIAQKQWEIYEKDLSQYIDVFKDRVDNFRGEANMKDREGATNLAYQSAYSEAKNNVAQELTARGVDPTSGKFKASMSEMTTEHGLRSADTVNRAQAAEQDKYIAGLSDYVAVGAGEQAEALKGISDVAALSTRKAIDDAQMSFNKRAANMQMAGAATGVGLRSYMQMKSPSPSGIGDTISTMRPRNNDHYEHSSTMLA
ncbi:hypothetical protein O1O06_10755 [Grimontia hollisae]|uniref:hypothetical protein n=1 Tax=Grimontia hollisae TaxID=673 RepID=UPI001303583C|nr:hypothetical protein [Grimontia hollisae]MDF2185252.1 hypothetical protein [Grimontia hollisae]